MVFEQLWQDVFALLLLFSIGVVVYARAKGRKVLTVLREIKELFDGGVR